MFLSEQQASRLYVAFSFAREDLRCFGARMNSPACAGADEALSERKKGSGHTLRELVDLALDRQLVMAPGEAKELEATLNRHLPPVWPGDSPIRFDFESTDNPSACRVIVPNRFHNRLHRFPFVDGFLVCPVPDCTGTPKLRGMLYGAGEGASYVMEHNCDHGHHWQCIFQAEADLTRISVVRLQPEAHAMPDGFAG